MEVQKDYQEFVLTGQKTQHYWVRNRQNYSYYDAWWESTVAESCDIDNSKGITTRLVKDRLGEVFLKLRIFGYSFSWFVKHAV